MVLPPHSDENGTTIQHPDICPPYEDEISSTKHKQPVSESGKYDWSQELQGLILSSFYWVIIVSNNKFDLFLFTMVILEILNMMNFFKHLSPNFTFNFLCIF